MWVAHLMICDPQFVRSKHQSYFATFSVALLLFTT